ncbi:MAG: GerMN domain-containing protein [Spirochaetia bacterium]
MARKKKSSLGFLFWVAVILLVIVVFLFNRDNISRVMDSTGFLDVVKNKFSSREEKPDESSEQEVPVIPEDQETSTDITVVEEPADQPGGTDAAGEETAPPPAADKPDPPPKTTDSEKQEIVTEKSTRQYGVYFIHVTEDGMIYPKKVEREVTFTDSPLTETINSLLTGPTSDELNQDLINLIPKGTILLSATVKNGIAYLNFNESFKFNTMGVEGYMAQLKQIVFTSTEFSTVKKVQFLVEGELLEFLSGEGVYIGKPLDRSSFS